MNARGKRTADEAVPLSPSQLGSPAKRLKTNSKSSAGDIAVQAKEVLRENAEHDPEGRLRTDGIPPQDIYMASSRGSEGVEKGLRDSGGQPSENQGPVRGSEHTAPAFIPYPAREPTPVNTLHNYFGGPAPEASAVRSKKTKTRPKAPPARMDVLPGYIERFGNGTVLIADLYELAALAGARGLQPGVREVTFRTKAQFRTARKSLPSEADMDATCTMTCFDNGIFRTKPRIWETSYVSKSDAWSRVESQRNLKFSALMQRVGQSAESFRARRVSGLLSEAQASFDTPAGTRTTTRDYAKNLQAGKYNPDALIRFDDGSYRAIYLKLFEGTRDLTSFKAVTDKYGTANVWLKNRYADYMLHEQFDLDASTFDAAEKTFCEYMGRVYEPNVFVRVSDEKWISKDRYDKLNEFNFDQDLTTLDLLILQGYNQGFMQPKTMKWSSPDLYQQRMRGAHLTARCSVPQQGYGKGGAKRSLSDILAQKENKPSASVLMQTSRDELQSIDRLPRGVARFQIYPQNIGGKTGNYTGNYTKTWMSIKRTREYNEERLGSSWHDPAQQPERNMTDEQIGVLRTPSPSPARLSDSDEDAALGFDDSSVADSDSSLDEPSSPPPRRGYRSFLLPPDDSSDDEIIARSASRRQQRPDSERDHEVPPDTPQGSNPVGRQFLNDRLRSEPQGVQAPEFPWPSDSSDDEPSENWDRRSVINTERRPADDNTDRATPPMRPSAASAGSPGSYEARSRGREKARD